MKLKKILKINKVHKQNKLNKKQKISNSNKEHEIIEKSKNTNPIRILYKKSGQSPEVKIINNFEKGFVKGFCTYKKSRFILQLMYNNSSEYLNYLKKINKETEIAESVLKNSMKNRELLKLLNLEKSLVYITTSLRSNEAVMERTLKIRNIKLYEEDEDILEDAIIENKQAIEMSKIYSDILNGTMDAYASIISNNLNRVMKFLTSITIVLAVPTMVSSFWGMNVALPFEKSPFGFLIMIVIATALTLFVTWWLRRKNMLD